LDGLGQAIYDELHKLRKYRNKIHIEDVIEINGVSPDEANAFSDDICIWSLGLGKRVVKYLGEKLARPKELDKYVAALSVPSP
jgi:hypothetical protein